MMDSDRDLRLVLLALREGLITPDQLLRAGGEWLGREPAPFLDFLAEGGWLPAEQYRRLAATREGPPPTTPTEPGAGRPAPAASTLNGSPATPRGLPIQTATDPGGAGEPATYDFPQRSAVAGRYQNLRPHRTGGLGRVWLARDTVLGRDVALKELRPDRTGDARLRRFLREARVTGQLEHPNIVPLYDLIEDAGGGPCYTMRFVAGRTLAEATRDYHQRRREGTATRLDLAGLLDAFVAVCRAVAFAHSRGVLHRDLKGQNVALGDFGEVLLLDWGLAKRLDGPGTEDEPAAVQPDPDETAELTAAGTMAGTPPFMGRELAEGEPASRASDVYALGVILYTILTGHLPYTGSAAEVLAKVRSGGPPRPRSLNPAVSPALEAVCLKAMAHDPAARYATAEQLADEVRRWLADEPVGAFRDPWTVRATRWARRHRTPVVAAAVFLLSAVVALAVSTGLVWSEQRRTAAEKQHADREWARAEKNLALARRLGPDFLDAADRRVAGLPRSDPVRKAIVSSALQRVQQALAEQPDDPELRYWVARLQRSSATLDRQFNKFDAAGQSYQESIRILEDLVAGNPAVPFYRDQLSETLRDSAQVLNRLGRLREAVTTLRRSADLAEGLRAEFPDQPDYRRTHATALLDLSGFEISLGDFAGSEAASRAAADLFRSLPRDRPGPQDGLLLVMTLNRSAEALRELGGLDEALAVHAEAVERIDALLVRAPGNPDYQHFRGRALVEQGKTLARFPDRRQQAEENFSTAVRIWDALQNSASLRPAHRNWQAVAYEARGQLRAAAGRLAPADDDLAKSRSLLEELVKQSPDVPGYRADLGRTYAALGRLALARGDPAGAADWLAKARQALREAVEAVPESETDRRDLAAVEAEAERLRAGR
jgi:serine/threonine-protein kinase